MDYKEEYNVDNAFGIIITSTLKCIIVLYQHLHIKVVAYIIKHL